MVYSYEKLWSGINLYALTFPEIKPQRFRFLAYN
jgi:hypothetical protein